MTAFMTRATIKLNWQARAWVKVVDDTGAVVEVASVTGKWTFKGSLLNAVSATTTSEGIAKLDSNRVGGSKIGFIYEPGANVETSDLVVVP